MSEPRLSAVRWWALDELETTGMLFALRRLPSLVRSLLAEGPPSSPVDVGV